MKQFFKQIIVYLITLEARAVLARYKPKIIAVTGNVGKTSTKEAAYAALSGARFVRKSEKSFNSEIGVPLTILGCENAWDDPVRWIKNILEGLMLILVDTRYPEWLVLEVGADRPGDIESITKWLHPQVVVMTGIPEVPVHVEYFDSPEALAAEKEYLVQALTHGGMFVYNADNPVATAMLERHDGRSLSYGFDKDAELRITHESIAYEHGIPTGMHFRIHHGGSSIPMTIPGVLGRGHVYAVAAGVAAGIGAGLDLATVTSAFAQYEPLPGRMRLLPGVHGSVILDDTYNASPAALALALDVLGELKTDGRKIAVLGDMLDLGKFSVEEHRKVGVHAAEAADLIATVGVRAHGIAEGARTSGFPKGRVKEFEQGASQAAGEMLAAKVQPGDIILVKGSQGMRMEHAVKALLADPAAAPALLARQDADWLRR